RNSELPEKMFLSFTAAGRNWSESEPNDKRSARRIFEQTSAKKTNVSLALLSLRFPQSSILGRKILALVVRPLVNLPKHLAGAIPTFLMRGESFQSPNWRKAANCRGELSQVRVLAAFWPLNSDSPRDGADCKFAGFTPSVVRIHSYSSSPRAILQVFKPFGGQ